jgi:hypothetical protein
MGGKNSSALKSDSQQMRKDSCRHTGNAAGEVDRKFNHEEGWQDTKDANI